MTDIEEETDEEEPIGIVTTFIEALANTDETLSFWRQLSAISGIILFTLISGITKAIWQIYYKKFLSIFGKSMEDSIAGNIFLYLTSIDTNINIEIEVKSIKVRKEKNPFPHFLEKVQVIAPLELIRTLQSTIMGKLVSCHWLFHVIILNRQIKHFLTSLGHTYIFFMPRTQFVCVASNDYTIYFLCMNYLLTRVVGVDSERSIYYKLGVAFPMKPLGTIMAGFSMYFIGRRINVVIASILDLMIIIILVSNSALEIMLVGYLLNEFAWAYTMVIFYVYVAEISDPRFRVSFMGTNEMLFHMPLLLTEGFIELHHMFLCYICLGLTCLSLILSVSAPESPYWLALTGRREMAENLFYHLHVNSVDSTEVVIMCDEAEQDAVWKAGGMHKIVWSSKFGIPLLIILFMMFSYGSMIHFGVDYIFNLRYTQKSYLRLWIFWRNYLLYTASNYCLIIGAIAFLWLALKIQRRILFIGSVSLGLLMIVPHLIISVVVSEFLLATCLYTFPLLYLFAYLGGNQLLRIIPVEIFPGPGRDLGSTIYFLLESLLDAFALHIINLESINVNSIGFRWLMFPFGFFFTILFMPETKDLSLINAHKIGSNLTQIKLFLTINELEIHEEEEIIN